MAQQRWLPSTQPELGDAKGESESSKQAGQLATASRQSAMAAISGLSWADVLHQAPEMLKWLHLYRSLDALLAINTSMLHLQQYVTRITIPDQSHMHTFAQDRWPNLQRMSFKSVLDSGAVAGLSQGGWQNSKLQLTFAKLEFDAIVALRSNTWPWQMLTDLAVYFGEGLPVDLHMLSTCQWPLLESLTLCCGRLDDAQANLIFRADWPLLQDLRLPDNCLCFGGSGAQQVPTA